MKYQSRSYERSCEGMIRHLIGLWKGHYQLLPVWSLPGSWRSVTLGRSCWHWVSHRGYQGSGLLIPPHWCYRDCQAGNGGGSGMMKLMLNSLWPIGTIWRQRSGSTLTQVMACITWTNVDWSSVKSSDIHIRAISQEMPQPLVNEIRLKITFLKCAPRQQAFTWTFMTARYHLSVMTGHWCVALIRWISSVILHSVISSAKMYYK